MECFFFFSFVFFDHIGKSLVKHAPLCAIRCPLVILSPFSAMCLADDVTGFSAMHGCRRIVGVISGLWSSRSRRTSPLACLCLYFLARFNRFPRLLDTSIGYFLYFRTAIHSVTRIHCFSLKWLIPRVPIKGS